MRFEEKDSRKKRRGDGRVFFEEMGVTKLLLCLQTNREKLQGIVVFMIRF